MRNTRKVVIIVLDNQTFLTQLNVHLLLPKCSQSLAQPQRNLSKMTIKGPTKYGDPKQKISPYSDLIQRLGKVIHYNMNGAWWSSCYNIPLIPISIHLCMSFCVWLCVYMGWGWEERGCVCINHQKK